MKTTIKLKGYENKHEMTSYAERRLQFALSRFSRRIQLAELRVSDANGPKGGEDQQVYMMVQFKEGAVLRLHRVGSGWMSCVDDAADRMSRMVARHLESERAFRFQSGMVPRERGFAA